MNIARLLLRGAEIAAATDAPAIAQGPVPLYGYPALIQRVRRLASGLSMRGVAPGDRVAVFMENRAEYFDLLLATWWIGAVAVPINAKLAPAELTVILDDAEPALVFTTMPLPDAIVVGTPEYAALMDHEPAPEAPHPVDSHAIAWLVYTSGTTGVAQGRDDPPWIAACHDPRLPHRC